MVDPELQRRLRSLLLRKPAMSRSIKIATITASLTATGMFLLLLYIGDVHKIPISTALARLEAMIADCTGEKISDVRASLAAAPGSRFPSFSMAGKLQSITTAIDRLKDQGCVSDGRRARRN